VTQVARLIDHDHDIGGAAGHMLSTDVRGHHVGRLNTVLKRDHNGVGADHRLQRSRRGVDVVHLHGEEHDIHGTDGLRTIGGLNLWQVE
jgi:hypothetical protein